MEILNVKDLSFTYPLCKEPAIKDISFSLNEGEICVVCGATGSGKSTLLRLLKRELAPRGEKKGRILFKGEDSESLSAKSAALSIGFVAQRPDEQIVTDKVSHELAFGLENLGLPQSVIASRIAEISSYFGIDEWFDRRTSELSGGEKQLLNLASVMVMGPELLILDEPTSRLDPIASAEFIATLQKLNRELSLTILIVEHRLEELIPVCDRLIALDGGRLICDGSPRELAPSLMKKSGIRESMPASIRLFSALDGKGDAPLTVREGKGFIERGYKNTLRSLEYQAPEKKRAPALEMRDVCMRYEKNSRDVLSHLDLTVYEGEIFCILGGNGSGKTTAVGCAAGLLRPFCGDLRIFGKKIRDYKGESLYRGTLSVLPQEVESLFLKNSVREELCGTEGLSLPFDLSHRYDKHPYDLSGGEMQLLALAKVLATGPRLLFMDEPTKALDGKRKEELIGIVKGLRKDGVTVVIVTHDVEFAALCADRVALFFRGRVMSVGTPRELFSQNSFYTTSAFRMTRGYFDGAVTVEEAAELCRRNGAKE